MKTEAANALPREPLRRRLEALGIPAERHGLGSMLEMLPAGLGADHLRDDADAVAEVLVYLVTKGLIEVPTPLVASLNVQWGAHLCQFYRSPEELLELVVPFMAQGLEDHERCIWVFNEPLSEALAMDALAAAVPRFERYADQISLHHFRDWYLDAAGRLKPVDEVLAAWRQAEQRALDQGYLGLRVTGDTMQVNGEWSDFQSYEASVHRALGGLRIKALCTYPARDCGRDRIRDVVCNHDTAFVKRESWQRIPAGSSRSAETVFASLNA